MILKNLKLKNKNGLETLKYVFFAEKFDKLKLLTGKNINILITAVTKIDPSFPNDQYRIEGFPMPFRIDRNRFGGGVLIYV